MMATPAPKGAAAGAATDAAWTASCEGHAPAPARSLDVEGVLEALGRPEAVVVVARLVLCVGTPLAAATVLGLGTGHGRVAGSVMFMVKPEGSMLGSAAAAAEKKPDAWSESRREPPPPATRAATFPASCMPIASQPFGAGMTKTKRAVTPEWEAVPVPTSRLRTGCRRSSVRRRPSVEPCKNPSVGGPPVDAHSRSCAFSSSLTTRHTVGSDDSHACSRCTAIPSPPRPDAHSRPERSETITSGSCRATSDSPSISASVSTSARGTVDGVAEGEADTDAVRDAVRVTVTELDAPSVRLELADAVADGLDDRVGGTDPVTEPVVVRRRLRVGLMDPVAGAGGEPDPDAEGTLVTSGIPVPLAVGEPLLLAEDVGVGCAEDVPLPLPEGDAVAVMESVTDALAVALPDAVAVPLRVAVAAGDADAEPVADAEPECVALAVTEGVGSGSTSSIAPVTLRLTAPMSMPGSACCRSS